MVFPRTVTKPALKLVIGERNGRGQKAGASFLLGGSVRHFALKQSILFTIAIAEVAPGFAAI